MKKNALLMLSVALVIGAILALPAFVNAQSSKEVIQNSVESADPGGPTVDNAVSAFITIFTIIVGVMAVVMIIFGGYKYITSGGDANKVAAAKATVMYALIGVVLVVLSQLILRFVIAKSVQPGPSTPVSPCPITGSC